MENKVLSPNDFDTLAQNIFDKVKSQINAKTLKRLYGYDKAESSLSIRLDTLNILAKYVGYDHWSEYVDHFRLVSGSGSGDFNGETINAEDLNVDDVLQISWQPDRISTLKYLGHNRFVVIATENSKWKVGDTFLCKHFIKGNPLYVDDLTDMDGVLKSKMYEVGGNGGISFDMVK